MNKIKLVIFSPKKETFLVKEFFKNFKNFNKFIDIKLLISNKKIFLNFRKKYKKKIFFLPIDKYNKKKIIKKIKIIKKNEECYGLILQYPFLIDQNIISLFNIIFNCHYGKLPDYRGHNTISHAILNREVYFYGTIHGIVETFDQGKIYSEKKIRINSFTPRLIEKKISKIFIKELLQIFKKIFYKKQIRPIKEIKTKGKFLSINLIKKLKKINNFSEIILKKQAFDEFDHEPAYIKIKKDKYYLIKNNYKNYYYKYLN